MNIFGKSQTPQPDPEAPPLHNVPVNVATADTSVRLAFLRKVYTLLTINLLITIGISCIFAFVDVVQDYVLDNSWIIWASLAVSFAALIALSCVKLAFPVNLLMMYVFVFSFSSLIGVIVARFYDDGYGPIVLQAFLATAAVFFTITTYVLITKKDFNFLAGFLGAALVILIILSVINFVFNFTTGGRSRAFSFGISVLGALVMTGYLLFDTSQVVNRYGPDQWLPAVISLYVDVTTLFLYLLNIFSFIDG